MTTKEKVRFAVVGLGHIAQIAVLPAFKNAERLCELTAFISDDEKKTKELSKKYGVQHTWSYDGYDAALRSKEFDAIYIALPNDMHKDFAVRASKAGIHVLCEKPMALSSECCKEMIKAAEEKDTKLMIAYRLHFEKANMQVVDLISKGKIGRPRYFNSSFSMQVRDGNIRTQTEHGGGPLNDIGIYCINAARYVFKEEPIQVFAMAAQSDDPRFTEVQECVSVSMKFPGDKLATFVCSFGSADNGWYEVVGTDGSVKMDPAFEYAFELAYTLKQGNKEEKHKISKHDQFSPELLHFAECIIENKQPRPSGKEGLNDIYIIEAIQESIRTGIAIRVDHHAEASKPDRDLVKEKLPVWKPRLVDVEAPSK